MMWPRHYGYGFMGGFGIVPDVLSVLFWIFLIVLLIRLFRHQKSEGSATFEKSPLDILKERYAKGEITKKEFEDMKKDIS
jgi:putative membrane protein